MGKSVTLSAHAQAVAVQHHDEEVVADTVTTPVGCLEHAIHLGFAQVVLVALVGIGWYRSSIYTLYNTPFVLIYPFKSPYLPWGHYINSLQDTHYVVGWFYSSFSRAFSRRCSARHLSFLSRWPTT